MADRTRLVIRRVAPVMGIASDAEFHLTTTEVDPLGWTHRKYHQVIDDELVWGSQLQAHFDARGAMRELSGQYARSAESVPQITHDKVRVAAARKLVAQALDVSVATCRYVDTLYYWSPNAGLIPAVHVNVSSGHAFNYDCFTNLKGNRLLATISNVCTGSATAQLPDLDGDIQPHHYLVEEDKSYSIDVHFDWFDPLTDDIRNHYHKKGVVHYLDFTTGNTWEGSPTTYPAAVVSAQSRINRTVHYFNDTHAWQSFDGDGSGFFCELGKPEDNAYWDPTNTMILGTGGGSFRNLAGSLDVIAHEFVHGVTFKRSGLIYQYQHGALDEHISDFFGCQVDDDDWLMGEDITLTATCLRNVAQPTDPNASDPQPDHMRDYRNLPADQDHGGVHTNSGILNRMGYLLADGPGGIGRQDASKIVFRAMQYLNPNSGFTDYRAALESAAEDLFGTGSSAVNAVRHAASAVGIYSLEEHAVPAEAFDVDGSQYVMYLQRGFLAEAFDVEEYLLYWLDDAGNTGLLSDTAAAPIRPAASGDGTLLLFVDVDNNPRLLSSVLDNEELVEVDDGVTSVGISKNGNLYAYTLGSGDDAEFYMYDLEDDTTWIYTPELTVADGPEIIGFDIDVLSFSPRHDFVYCDAKFTIDTPGGAVNRWAIARIRLADGHSELILPPDPDYDRGNVVVGNRNPELLLFEARHSTDYQSYARSYDPSKKNRPDQGITFLFMASEPGIALQPTLAMHDDAAYFLDAIDDTTYIYRFGLAPTDDGLMHDGTATSPLTSSTRKTVWPYAFSQDLGQYDSVEPKIQVSVTAEPDQVWRGENVSWNLAVDNIGTGMLRLLNTVPEESAGTPSDLLGNWRTDRVGGSLAPGQSIYIETSSDTITVGNHQFNVLFDSTDYRTPRAELMISVEVKAPTEMTFEFSPGWNSFGLPFCLADESIDSVFGVNIDNIIAGAIYTFDTEQGQYERVTQFERGQGYWIYARESFDLSLFAASSDYVEPELRDGWNFVAMERWWNRESYQRKLGSVWQWQPVREGYVRPEVIVPGSGLWVFQADTH